MPEQALIVLHFGIKALGWLDDTSFDAKLCIENGCAKYWNCSRCGLNAL